MTGGERIMIGTIVEVLPHALYRVDLPTGPAVVAHLGDTARDGMVHVRPGQRVRVAVSAYDAARGRILGPARQGETA